MIEIGVKRDADGKMVAEVLNAPPLNTEEDIHRCKGLMAESRLRVMIQQPYFGKVVMNMGQRYSDKVERAAVDKYGRLYMNAKWMLSLTDGERDAILLHEAFHLLLMHTERADAMNVDHELYNIAGDMSINAILREAGLPMPKGSYYPETLGFPNLLSTEEYYQMIMELVKQNQDQNGNGKGKGAGQKAQDMADQSAQGKGDPNGSDGTGGGGKEGKWEEGMATGDTMSPQEKHEVREAVAQAMREHSKSRGNLPGGWERWIDEMLGPPRVRWDRRLFQVVAAALTEVKGRTHITWEKIGRRRIPGFMLPAKRSFIPQMGLFVDNSGSMGDVHPESPLGKALREAQGLIEQMALPYVYYGAVDANPNFDMVQTNNILREKLVGGGGTDMRLAWTKAEEMGLHVMVLFTDGYTPWPEEQPAKMHSIVVLTAGDPDVGVPDWCHTILVKD